MQSQDTIYALSSGSLPAGVAVIRLSGQATPGALSRLCGKLPVPRQAALRSIRDRNNERLDEGLVIHFPAPKSFTGEHCGEIQIHGGRAVVQAVLAELAAMDGLRHAEAGEFSRRAFQNGKLDLVEIEGLADLIAAETEMQRRLAMEQASGGLSRLYHGWATRLTHARAMIEAELDFADEDDVPSSVAESVWSDMRDLHREMLGHLAKAAIGEIVRDGLKVVIAGPPNAGKSSLMNHLAGRDVAIVTDIAGTTRDVLSVDISLAGFSVQLFDTAGLRDTDEPIEREGIKRAHATLADADLILLLNESGLEFDVTAPATDVPCIRVATKSDISTERNFSADVCISTISGAGVDDLLERISSYLPNISGKSSFSVPSRRRHVDCLSQASKALDESLKWRDRGLDIQAEQLRLAADALGKITGRVDVENLLDVIFSEFCIGK